MPADQKKLRELRTLKQHYYPEGGWGWVVVLVACCVHILVLGTQTVLATIVISFGKPNSVSRKLQPEISGSASKWWSGPRIENIFFSLLSLEVFIVRVVLFLFMLEGEKREERKVTN